MKYETPKLSRLGDLRELTNGGFSGGGWDGGSYRKSYSPPNDS